MERCMRSQESTRRRAVVRVAWSLVAWIAGLGLDVPASLHPVIDRDVCIGSGSCLEACPEGDILGLVNGIATLVDASKCIGHGRCASECPVQAIRLVFGTAERVMRRRRGLIDPST